jgi:TetR/AcrR family transcriptional repressor of nem operon
MTRWKSGHKGATRSRIVETAGRFFRELGYEKTGVADVMRAAGLTVGGFYAHFDSKERLFTEALSEAFANTRNVLLLGLDEVDGASFVREVTRRYLSRMHRDHPEHGCVLPALAAEAGRQGAAPREAIEAYLREMLDLLETKDARSAHAKEAGLSVKEHALALTALCVGGILLSRAVEDEALSNAILKACRRFAVAEST